MTGFMCVVVAILGPLAILLGGVALSGGLSTPELLAAVLVALAGFTSKAYLSPTSRKRKGWTVTVCLLGILFSVLVGLHGFERAGNFAARDRQFGLILCGYLPLVIALLLVLITVSVIRTPARKDSDLQLKL